jgi:ethanolamine ammonia-lyase small subunit
VYEELDAASLGREHVLVRSAAPDRATYLRRPDLGRTLSEDSRALVTRGDYDAALVIADGLSAPAVHRHAGAVLDAVLPLLGEWRLAPLVVVRQGRVAVGDEIGELMGARQVAMLIGERPGLTSPDSLGIYLTWAPRVGRSDAERNCISNVRTEGISYTLAARKLHYLMERARVRRITGVELKEELPLEG